MTRGLRVLDGVLEVGLMALLCFAPWPGGSVYPWAHAVVEGGVALLIALVLVRAAVAGEARIGLTPLLWPALAMACLVLWQLLAPNGSVSWYATWESARLYAAYLGVVVVVSTLPMTRGRVARLMLIVVAWAVVLAGLGFARQLGVAIPGLPPPRPDSAGRLTSTFVNPNHQALHFALALFLALGLLLRSAPGPRRPAPAAGRASELLGSLPARVLLAGAALVLALGVLGTLSRGGVVSVLAGLLAMLLLALSARRSRRAIVPVLASLCGIVLYAAWIGLEAVVERFALVLREPVADLRWHVWGATLRMVGDEPITGVGLGAFQDGFSPFRPPEVPGEKVVDYAHNDYLQLLAETGLLGLLAAAWAIVALLAYTVPRWRARRDPFARGLVLGALGALAAALTHSVVDFGLHMPANALLVALVAALLPVVVTLHGAGAEERVGMAAWRLRVPPAAGVACVGLAALIVGAGALVLLPAGMAARHVAAADRTMQRAARTPGVVTQSDLVRARADLRRAIAWDPRNPAAWERLAEVSTELAARAWVHGIEADGALLADRAIGARFRAAQPLLAEALEAYREALRRRPRASEVHERFAWFLGGLEGVRHALGGHPGAWESVPMLAGVRAADGSLASVGLAHAREAIRWDPANAYRHRSLGILALDLDASPSGREMAAAALVRALSLRRDLLGPVLDDLLARGADDALLLASVPGEFRSLLDLGRELERRGIARTADVAFQRAIELAGEPRRELEARLEHGRALAARDELHRALDQARHALVLAPTDADVFALLGSVYRRMGQPVEAEEALTTAVRLAAAGPVDRRNALRADLAELLVERGQEERAVALWAAATREQPHEPWGRLQFGRLLQRLGRASEALREYRAAALLGGDDWSLHWRVGRAFRDAGHLREAVASFETARRIHPAGADLGAELGELYARIGRPAAAAEQYRAVLRRDPGHAAALRGLADLATSTGS